MPLGAPIGSGLGIQNVNNLRIIREFARVPGLKTEVILNGWPKDEKVFDGADAVVFYMDGGAKHEAVQVGRRRLDMLHTLSGGSGAVLRRPEPRQTSCCLRPPVPDLRDKSRFGPRQTLSLREKDS